MIYPAYKLDSDGRLLECPMCNSEEMNNGEFCKICGINIINRCANFYYEEGERIYNCTELADGNARFCKVCGCETTFFKNNLLIPWQEERSNIQLPF